MTCLQIFPGIFPVIFLIQSYGFIWFSILQKLYFNAFRPLLLISCIFPDLYYRVIRQIPVKIFLSDLCMLNYRMAVPVSYFISIRHCHKNRRRCIKILIILCSLTNDQVQSFRDSTHHKCSVLISFLLVCRLYVLYHSIQRCRQYIPAFCIQTVQIIQLFYFIRIFVKWLFQWKDSCLGKGCHFIEQKLILSSSIMYRQTCLFCCFAILTGSIYRCR